MHINLVAMYSSPIVKIHYCCDRDNKVECVVFDECAYDAYMCQVHNTEQPVVMVLNLARVAFAAEGKYESMAPKHILTCIFS